MGQRISLLECRSGEDEVGNDGKRNTHEKAYEPGRKKGTENVKRGRTPAACDFYRQQRSREN